MRHALATWAFWLALSSVPDLPGLQEAAFAIFLGLMALQATPERLLG